ncbi:MAG TPA: RDD family protein [Acidimicrobiales bacterium]|nr:RDD family protein [Acidimicrobiales bacterium]
MSYEDRISIATPEGVDLDLTLAGLGSRFVAALVDGLIQGAVFIALAILAGLLSAGGEEIEELEGGLAAGIALALLFVAMFLIFFGYHVAFETWASGRTPGKRWTGLRVVRLGGAPVSFLPSAVRNLVRLVDFLPTAYGVGIVALLVTSRNQRLGDLAAGTLVVRERRTPRPAAPGHAAAVSASASELPPGWLSWDVSAVSAEDLGTVRRFLERRAFLTSEARSRLAFDLAARLRTKVSGPPEDLHPEEFLAEVAAAKSARG